AQRLHGRGNFFVPEGDVSYYDALVALAKGDRAEATNGFQRFLREVPQSPFASRARDHLKELGVHAPAPHNPNRIVHIGVVSANGPRTALEINSTMKDFLSGSCVPLQSGIYTLEGKISGDGEVSWLVFEPPDDRSMQCLRDAARAWRFGPAKPRKPTRFTVRL